MARFCSFAFVPRLSSCRPLTREVANPEDLTEGEIRRAYAKGDAQRIPVANSLPQSPAATAPSSEGAKGLGCRRKHPVSPPTTPCLPCVRGGAERMRSGGVVGVVQEEVACNRQPVPARYPQPLSQGLRPCQLPFSIAGVSAETPLRHRAPQKLRFCGGPENSIDFRQMNCRKSDAGTRRRGPRAICPAPRERRNAAGSRFFRRLRRFDQMGSPAQFTPGKGTMFLP